MHQTKLLALLFLLNLLLNGLPAPGAVLFRPKNIEEVKALNHVSSIDAVFVEGAEVAWVNYSLLRRDFPTLDDSSEKQIDAWILKNFSYISNEQLELSPSPHSPIPINPDLRRTTYRQPNQGRGDLAVAFDSKGKEIGLVDLKGTGVTGRRRVVRDRLWKLYQRNNFGRDKFEKRGSVNGLMALSDSILETAVAQALNVVFENQSSNLPTAAIEQYFIIRLPFDILRGESQGTPASIIGRQAHVGRIWIGTNPFHELSNIKQTDFFGSYTDTGTTRIRLPGLPDYLSGRRGHSLAIQREPVEQSITAFLAGDKHSIQHFIDQSVADVSRKVPSAKTRVKQSPILNIGQAVDLVALWIQADPTRFARFSATLIQLQKMGRSDLLGSAQVQKAILELLKVGWSTFEDSTISGEVESRRKSARRFGLALIPSLSQTEVRNHALREASFDRRDLAELVRVMMFLAPEENDRIFLQIKDDSELRNIYAHELRKLLVAQDHSQSSPTSKQLTSYWQNLRQSFPNSSLYLRDERSFSSSCQDSLKVLRL